MLGFGKQKYSETPWKTADGEYKCQEEICPPGLCGSGECPLDLYTTAMEAAQTGDLRAALPMLAQVLAKAPDFPDAWFNLGCIYGNMGEAVRARDAFRTAVRLRPDYPQARAALAVAERQVGGGASVFSATDVLDHLLDVAVRIGDMREKEFKNVPELLAYGNDIGRQIVVALRKDAATRGEKSSAYMEFRIALLWAVYAGFGAVLEWNNDWPRLQATGVFEKLTAARGVYGMDEYVTSLYTGEAYDTDAGIVPTSCRDFAKRMSLYNAKVADLVLEGVPQEDTEKIAACLPEVAKGCYLFGMALALEKVMG